MTTAPSLIRLWDADFNLLYSSDTDSRTVEEFMAESDLDEANYTEDRRTRRAGKIIRTPDGLRRYDAREFLNYILSENNPSL